MTTREDIRQRSGARGEQPTTLPGSWRTGLVKDFRISGRSLPEVVDSANQSQASLVKRVDAELRRIGRFFDRFGYYKDGKAIDVNSSLIVDPGTDGVLTVLTKDTTETDIVNTATLTTIFSFNIPGGTIGDDGYVELEMMADYFNNSGAARGLRYVVTLGGTTYIDYSTPSAWHAARTTRNLTAPRLRLVNLGSESSNWIQLEGFHGDSPPTIAGTQTTGIGGYPTYTFLPGYILGSGKITEDTSSDTLLELKIAHSAAHASLSYRQLYSILRRTA